MKNNGNRYTAEFKADILRLIQEEKHTIARISNDFGVNAQTVRNWLQATKEKHHPEKLKIAELEAELKEAKKKLADQELTIDILKKATAIFVQSNRK